MSSFFFPKLSTAQESTDGTVRIAALYGSSEHLARLRDFATAQGYRISFIQSDNKSIGDLASLDFDLVLLGWQSTATDTVKLIKFLRNGIGDAVPIIIVADPVLEADVSQGLDAGATDYVLEPLRLMELKTRIAAALKRLKPKRGIRANDILELGQNLDFGPYRFDSNKQTVEFQGSSIKLARREYNLARLLFENVGRLVHRKIILESVWEISISTKSRSIDTYICRLRSRLALRPENGYVLSSVHGCGYRLDSVQSGEGCAFKA